MGDLTYEEIFRRTKADREAKKRMKPLEDFAKQASDEGLTYGQLQARESLKVSEKEREERRKAIELMKIHRRMRGKENNE